MTAYEAIYEAAIDNFGLVTTREARDLGVSEKALNALAARGRLERRGYGVYRLSRHVPTPQDRYAEALALAGAGSILHGESVLALNDLGLAEPDVVHVQTSKRCRRALPGWIHVVPPPIVAQPVFYEGIACQPVVEAIRVCRGRIMPERLSEAARAAREKGLLSFREAAALRREVRA